MAANGEPGQSCHACGAAVGASHSFCRACGRLIGDLLECEQHPERSAEYVCVVCGIPLCSSCRSAQPGPALCRAEDHAVIATEWELLFQSGSEFEGDCVATNVAAEEIPVRTFSSRQHLSAPVTGASDVVRVFVRRSDRERAQKRLLEVLGTPEDDPPNVE
jgi:B-box zinc finger